MAYLIVRDTLVIPGDGIFNEKLTIGKETHKIAKYNDEHPAYTYNVTQYIDRDGVLSISRKATRAWDLFLPRPPDSIGRQYILFDQTAAATAGAVNAHFEKDWIKGTTTTTASIVIGAVGTSQYKKDIFSDGYTWWIGNNHALAEMTYQAGDLPEPA